jgi:hypothetical protein
VPLKENFNVTVPLETRGFFVQGPRVGVGEAPGWSGGRKEGKAQDTAFVGFQWERPSRTE